MTNRPVFQVEVDDTQFKRFQAEFDKFNEANKQVPSAWLETEKVVDRLTDKWHQINGVLNTMNGVHDEIDESQEKTNSSSKTLLSLWVSTTGRVGSSAKAIRGSTMELAKWRGFTVAIGGLLGVGSLYGLNALANQVSQRRTASMGLGLSYGDRLSLMANFGRLGSPEAIMGGISTALVNPNQQQPFASLGMDLRGKDTGQVFRELIPRLKELADKLPEGTMNNALAGYNLDQIGVDADTMRRIKRMSPEEIQSMMRASQADTSSMDLTKDVQRRWTEFDTLVGKAWTRIENVLARNLVGIAPGLTGASNAFVKLADTLINNTQVSAWLTQFEKSFERFAAGLGSSETQDKIRRFMKEFDLALHHMRYIDDFFRKGFTSAHDLWKPPRVDPSSRFRFGRQESEGFAAAPTPREDHRSAPAAVGRFPTHAQRNAIAAPDVKPVAESDRPAPLPSSHLFGRRVDTQDVNPRLLEVTAAAEKYLPGGYHARIKEGFNAYGHVPGSMHHKKGEGALDIEIIDPNGHAVPDVGEDTNGIYHRYARGVYGETLRRYPELAPNYAWGGQFGASRTDSRSDLMHHDFGGPRGHYEDNNPQRMGPLPEQLKDSGKQSYNQHHNANHVEPVVHIANHTDGAVIVQFA